MSLEERDSLRERESLSEVAGLASGEVWLRRQNMEGHRNGEEEGDDIGEEEVIGRRSDTLRLGNEDLQATFTDMPEIRVGDWRTLFF